MASRPRTPSWTPPSSSRARGRCGGWKGHGTVRLRHALKRSINIPAIKLGIIVGPDQVARYAHDMGITSRLAEVYSLALGSGEVTLFDMVKAYGVLANQGTRLEPYAVERIEDRNGRVLTTHMASSYEAISPATAYVVTSMLESVINSGTGWAARAWGFGHPAAGKTGTTNDCTDAWFVGFTPNVVCGVWGGFDDRRSIGNKMTGAKVALPVWTEFMKAAHVDLPKTAFEAPPGVVTRRICARTGELAGSDCEETLNEVFIQGSEPVRQCRAHSPDRRSRRAFGPERL